VPAVAAAQGQPAAAASNSAGMGVFVGVDSAAEQALAWEPEAVRAKGPEPEPALAPALAPAELVEPGLEPAAAPPRAVRPVARERVWVEPAREVPAMAPTAAVAAACSAPDLAVSGPGPAVEGQGSVAARRSRAEAAEVDQAVAVAEPTLAAAADAPR
jgi:DNA polymerase-3 subunit gamma/tau